MTVQEKTRLLTPPGETAANSESWYELAVYLSQQTGIPIKPVQTSSSEEFQTHITDTEMVFASADQLFPQMQKYQFRPLVQPRDYYEEAVIVAGPAANDKHLDGINSAIIGGVKGSFANRLGLTCLSKRGITPASQLYFSNWLKLTRALQQEKIAYAILSRSYLEQLSDLSRNSLQPLARTEIKKAFPLILYNPAIKDQVSTLRAPLLEMHKTEKGRSILGKLKMKGWQPPQQDQIITMLQMVRGKT